MPNSPSGSTALDAPYNYDAESSYPPSVFKQIKPTNRDSKYLVVIPDGDNHDIWMRWWKGTEFRRHSGKDIDWQLKKMTQKMWEHLVPVAEVKTGKPEVLCRVCLQVLAHPSLKNAGTSALKRHLESNECQKRARQQEKQQSMQSSRSQSSEPPPATIPAIFSSQSARAVRQNQDSYIQQLNDRDPDGFAKHLVLLIASLRLPFQTLAHPDFRKALEWARKFPVDQPLQTVSPYQAKNIMMQEAIQARQNILAKIVPQGKIAIALDCWTSPHQLSFLAVTGYFIDKGWRYHEIILGFEEILGAHTGKQLYETVKNCLTECGLTLKQVSAMTSDNASNNKTLHQVLEDAIKRASRENQQSFIRRVPCLAHIIQLASNAILGKISGKRDLYSELVPEIRPKAQRGPVDTVQKVRWMAKYVRSSPKRKNDFRACQRSNKALNLILSVSTRWNSTWLMLLRFRRLKLAVIEYINDHGEEEKLRPFHRVEWRHIDYLIDLLRPFYIFTVEISRMKRSPTVQLVIRTFDTLIAHLQKYTNILRSKSTPWKIELRDALETSRTKLLQYFKAMVNGKDDIYGTAMLLDPQARLEAFEEMQSDIVDGRNGQNYLTSLNNRISAQDIDTISSFSEQRSESPCLPSSPLSSKSTEQGLKRSASSIWYPKKKSRLSSSEPETTRYLQSGLNFGIDFASGDASAILDFWRLAESRYPALAPVARELLAIPASGVGVERLFSEARDICTYRRHRLKSNTIKWQMILSSVGRIARADLLQKVEKETEYQMYDDTEDLDEAINDLEDDNRSVISTGVGQIDYDNEDEERDSDWTDEVPNREENGLQPSIEEEEAVGSGFDPNDDNEDSGNETERVRDGNLQGQDAEDDDDQLYSQTTETTDGDELAL